MARFILDVDVEEGIEKVLKACCDENLMGGSVTITVSAANYTKIGRLVTVQGYLGIGGDGDGTQMRIGGLPFTAKANTYESAIGRFSTYGDTANVYVSTASGQTYLWVITKNTFLNENQIDGAGGDWNFSLTYHTDA